jgi:hypothetical protein
MKSRANAFAWLRLHDMHGMALTLIFKFIIIHDVDSFALPPLHHIPFFIPRQVLGIVWQVPPYLIYYQDSLTHDRVKAWRRLP